MTDGSLAEFMAELRTEFLGDLPAHDQEVAQCWAAAQDPGQQHEALARLMARAHRLTGLGKTFGAPTVSDCGAALELALTAADGAAPSMEHLAILVADLRAAIAAAIR